MINRYTTPIQSQYIPTGPTPEMQMMLLRKRSEDEAMAAQQKAILESELLKTKAYGEEDKNLLKNISSSYEQDLNRIYDTYKDDPAAIIANMRGLNSRFLKDKTGGDLYNIDYRYGKAQEDITDANERLGKGDISEYTARTQLQNAGSGFRAPKFTDPIKRFEAIIPETFKESSYSNKEEAWADAYNVFLDMAGSELQYMTKEEQINYINTARSVFDMKYKGGGANRGGQGMIHEVFNIPEGMTPTAPYQANIRDANVNIDDTNFLSNGSLKRELVEKRIDDEAFKFSPSPYVKRGYTPSEAEKQAHKDRVERFDRAVKEFGIEGNTDKEKHDKYIDIINSVSADFRKPYAITETENFKPNIPKFDQLHKSNAKITIDGEPATVDDLNPIIADMKEKATDVPLIDPITKEIYYEVTTKEDGKTHRIGFTGYNESLKNAGAQTEAIYDNITQGNFGKGNYLNIPGALEAENPTTKQTEKGIVYDYIEIIPEKGGDGRFSFNIVPYTEKDGKKVQLTEPIPYNIFIQEELNKIQRNLMIYKK